MGLVRRAWERLLKFIDWTPILWRDEDWDWSYILLVFAHKLKRQRECILRNEIIAGAQDVYDQIKVCEDALRRMAADEYNDEKMVAFRERTRKPLIVRVKAGMMLTEEEGAEFKELIAEEDMLRKADEQLFAKTFLEGYRGWWD
mgnify:CR=1 FL=1